MDWAGLTRLDSTGLGWIAKSQVQDIKGVCFSGQKLQLELKRYSSASYWSNRQTDKQAEQYNAGKQGPPVNVPAAFRRDPGPSVRQQFNIRASVHAAPHHITGRETPGRCPVPSTCTRSSGTLCSPCTLTRNLHACASGLPSFPRRHWPRRSSIHCITKAWWCSSLPASNSRHGSPGLAGCLAAWLLGICFGFALALPLNKAGF